MKTPVQLHSLVLLQSSASQSALPVLRHLFLNSDQPKTLLFSFLYQPAVLINNQLDNVVSYDFLERIPGYPQAQKGVWNEMNSIVQSSLNESVHVIIDSLDCLLEDGESVHYTFYFLSRMLALVRESPHKSRLILHGTRNVLMTILSQPSFSTALTLIIAHPAALVLEIATNLGILPPLDDEENPKFWNVFLPIEGRQDDVDRLVLGEKGDGGCHSSDLVLHILQRDSTSRRRTIERKIRGWDPKLSDICSLSFLPSLSSLYNTSSKSTNELSVNATHTLSFNLSLTSSQQESRSQVPLPYVHQATTPAILYDPDSADDLDDDDPDDDLDI